MPTAFSLLDLTDLMAASPPNLAHHLLRGESALDIIAPLDVPTPDVDGHISAEAAAGLAILLVDVLQKYKTKRIGTC